MDPYQTTGTYGATGSTPPAGYAPPGASFPPPPGYTLPGGSYPPPPGGYPMPPLGGPPQASLAPAAPRGLRGIARKWRRVTLRPGTASFAVELETANWRDILVAIFALGIFKAAADYGHAFLSRQGTHITWPAAGGTVATVLFVPIVFFVSMAILFVSARIFRGAGSFREQSYAFSLYGVPVAGAGAVLAFVPLLGGVLVALLGIYELVLAFFAVAASQRLSMGRAAAAVLLPLAFVAVVVVAALALIGFALFALIHALQGL